MSFELSQIDRAIEWAVKDEIIRQGFWPDKRTVPKDSDLKGVEAALTSIDRPIKVFGVGEFQDRKQLWENNVIIDRVDIHEGNMTEPNKFSITLADLLNIQITQKKKKGSCSIEYEVRFVCDDIALDRKINQMMFNAFEEKVFLNGLADKTLESMTEGFWVYLQRRPIQLGRKKYIERLWRLIVSDVQIGEQEEINDSNAKL